MGYMLDIDEMTEEALVGEIAARKARRAAGRCDYCDQDPAKPSCKFPSRHYASVPDMGALLAQMRADLDARMAYSGDPDPGGTRVMQHWVPLLQAAWAKTPVLTK